MILCSKSVHVKKSNTAILLTQSPVAESYDVYRAIYIRYIYTQAGSTYHSRCTISCASITSFSNYFMLIGAVYCDYTACLFFSFLFFFIFCLEIIHFCSML